jgi:hypothetical protein
MRALLLLALLTIGRAIAAQPSTADVVRGRVTADSGRRAIVATVFVTRGSDRAVQQATTDSTGRWSLRFDPGTGDYLVYAAAPGYQSARRRVQRTADEREFIVDLDLPSVAATTLAQVTVREVKPRPDNGVRLGTEEVGASEKWVDGVAASVAPTARGDIPALLSTVPGVVVTAGGVSSLGASPTSTLTTLNGLALPAGQLPRGASVDARFSAGTMDPTRGGFAGGQMELRLAPGDRDYQQRRAWIAADANALQATDAVGRNIGAPVTGTRLSAGASGEAIRRTMSYNMSVDAARAVSTQASLFDASDATRAVVALSPEAISRLASAAGRVGLPISASGGSPSRITESVALLARLDDTRDTSRVLALTTFLSGARRQGLDAGPLIAANAVRRAVDATGSVQLLHQRTARGGRTFNETRFALSLVRQTGEAASIVPAAIVLVDDSAGTTALLGGSPTGDRNRAAWTMESASEWSWRGTSPRHRFRAIGWARLDGVRDATVTDPLGTWRYPSIAAVADNQPAAFTRTLAQPVRDGRAINAATAVAHLWSPTPRVQLLSGARLEASDAPSRIHLSPRVGLTVNLPARDKRSAQFFPEYATVVRPTMGVLRAGIGEFRDLHSANTVAMIRAGAVESLACVGATVPLPAWPAQSGGGNSAAACVGPPSVLAQRAPSTMAFARGWDVPRSWRGHLNWSAAVGPLLMRVEGAGAVNLGLPSMVDRNVDATTQTTLRDEGRALFVPIGAIDPRSGATSSAASRRSAAFATQRELRSDLRSTAGQLSLALSSDLFRLRNQFYSASWTVQRVRQQFRGADGANLGDPMRIEWARGTFDARHTLLLQAAVPLPARRGTFTLFSRVQSGVPFTPIVQGDVDGDGVAGDRAFVFDPAGDAEAARAAGMRDVLGGAAAPVRACLREQFGRVAARQSCTGPWTVTTNARVDLTLPGVFAGRRAQLSLNVANLASGLDLLLHGSTPRGWGNPALPDPVLLVPRGFDVAARRYLYAVNPRFGSTRPQASLLRDPFRVTLDVTLDFSRSLAEQRLARTLEPQRRERGRWIAPTLDDMLGTQMRQVSSVHRVLLAMSDTLFLTRSQIDSLREADGAFQQQARALFRPLAERLAALPAGYDRAAVLADVRATELAYQRLFWAQRATVRAVLTPLQGSVMPEIIKMIMAYTLDADSRRWPRWFFSDDGSRAGVGGPP